MLDDIPAPAETVRCFTFVVDWLAENSSAAGIANMGRVWPKRATSVRAEGSLGKVAWSLFVAALFTPAVSAERLVFKWNGQTLKLEGSVLAEDRAGAILFEGPDTRHYIISASDQLRREPSPSAVTPFGRAQLRASLEKELGPRFKIHQTNNYIIAYSCSTEYAQQAGRLFERAFAYFTNYFRNKGNFSLEKPRQPLIAIIYASRAEYVAGVQSDLGPDLASATSGVYLPMSNRMYMYNAFGGNVADLLRESALVNQVGAVRAARALGEQNVSTLIHESIHQIAYNTGFHNRHVRNPLWLVEGMAMYFEAPDSDAKDGWKGAGGLNRIRMEDFLKNWPKRPTTTLTRLITDDAFLRDSATAEGAYAEAWAFTYFAAKTKTQSYVKLIKRVNARKPLVPYTPEERLDDFRDAFGKAPDELDIDFRRYVQTIWVKSAKSGK